MDGAVATVAEAARGTATRRDYEKDRDLCLDFLKNFIAAADADSADDNAYGSGEDAKYMRRLQGVANRELRSLEVSLDDIASYANRETSSSHEDWEDLLAQIMQNTRRYLSIFADAADELMPTPIADRLQGAEDIIDVLTRQRREHADNENAQLENEQAPRDPNRRLPPELLRRYEVRFRPLTKHRSTAIRDVKASSIGGMVSVKGIVTKVHDVKPMISVAAYTCDTSGFEVYQEVTGSTYMPIFESPTVPGGLLFPQTRGSKFVKFQEVKIQEMSEQVPMGHIPRTQTVHLRGELTRSMKPGDVVEVTGMYLPVPYTGFRAMRAGLLADTYLEALSVHQFKESYTDYTISEEMREAVEELATSPDVYNRLASSLAPEIFGHEDIKKALLLQLVGGVNKACDDGMKLRGDLHLCLMGDPGVAKSQLLKHICKVAPRCVYTTGRGSSGVGLTASVIRDEVTNDLVLEGGALVLADMGIACIDEFDKMEESDRTAIHEVMEQQTVSIAKAGITTTLNARTSVLAAANPAWGRYDMRRSPAENIAMPAALLSRFDLLWLILDRADEESDTALAQHILHVHTHLEAPPALAAHAAEGEGGADDAAEPLDAATLRAYISEARKLAPTVPRELAEYISAAYAQLRQEEAQTDAPHSYTTARTLTSILRLSQALCRLRMGDRVAQLDIEESLRLMKMSKISLYADQREHMNAVDPISDIYTTLRDYAIRQRVTEIPFGEAKRIIQPKGHSVEILKQCLDEYASLDVWNINEDFDISIGEHDLGL